MMSTNGDKRGPDLVALGAGALVAALGLVVLVGWYVNSTALVQVLPHFVPMQYNTALGFVLGGMGLAALAFGWRRVSVASAAAAMIVGLLTLIQYVFDVDLHIDQLFMEHYITVKTSHPGRMAPNTALGFSLTGLALMACSLTQRRRHAAAAAGLIGGLIAAVGLMPLAGYFSGMESAYGWGHLTRMAVHTALGFIVCGTGLTAWAWRRDLMQHATWPRWAPLLGGLMVITFSILMWQALVSHQQQLVQREMAATARQAVSVIENDLRARVKTLVRMARRWETAGHTPRKQWELDAHGYVRDDPGYQAIQWVDATCHVRWVVPLKGNEQAQDLDLTFEAKRRRALEAAREARSVTVTSPVQLVQGGSGFLVYVPIHVKEEFAGFILAVFRIDRWLDAILPPAILERYGITVQAQDLDLYHRMPPGETSRGRGHAIAQAHLFDQAWRVAVEPSNLTLRETRSNPAGLLLVFGLLFMAGVATNVRLARTVRGHAAEATAAAQRLSEEVQTRRRAEATLSESEERLKRAVVDAPFPVMIHAEDGQVIHLSHAWCEMTGYAPEQLTNIADWMQLAYGDRKDLVREVVDRLYDAGHRVHDGEFTVRTADGGERLWDFSSAPLGRLPDGRRLVVSMASDVTERHRNTRQLNQTLADLEKTNRELEQFNRAAVGREHQMIELKRQINELVREKGEPPPYNLDYAKSDEEGAS